MAPAVFLFQEDYRMYLLRLRFWVLVLFAVAGFFGQVAMGAGDEPGQVRFLDSFEALKTENGALSTEPSVGSPIVGAIHGTAKLVDGKKGRALQLSGASNVLYQDFKALDLLGGEASFWIKLDFDPHAKAVESGGGLNVIFLTVATSDGSHFQLYSQLFTSVTAVAFVIRNPQGDMILNGEASLAWKQGEWHQLRLTWGRALEVWVDGEKGCSIPWDGLFGPVLVEKEKMRLFVGNSNPGYSDFTMDELAVLGPRPGNVASRPRMSVPLLEGAPALDGKLDDPFWEKAGKATGFVGYNQRELVRNQPAFLAAYTAEGLYLGARIPLPEGRPPKAALTAHNAGIYTEDAFELLLQPNPSSPAFCQFSANAIGTKAEVQYTDKGEPERSFNPDWKVATSSKDGEWTATAFIPFKALSLAAAPKAGDVWGGNFVVDSSSGLSAARTWAFAGGDFLQPLAFGELLFTGKARALREESFAGFSEGNPAVQFDLVGDLPPVVRVKAEIFDSRGKSVIEKTVRMSDSPATVVGTQYLQTGVYTAQVSAVDEAKTEFFRQNVLFRISKAFTLGVKNYPYAGVAEAMAGMGALEGKAAEVSFKLLSPKGQDLASQSVKQFVRGSATAKIETADLEPGEYIVEASAADAQGKPLGSVQQGLKIYPKPAWWKNNLGMDHSVPPPWTPVIPTEEGYGVWGRDYQFEDSVFPRQIVSRGKPVFTATPRVILRAGGKVMDLVTVSRQPAKLLEDQVELSAATDAGGVSARLKGTLEFDGCYRFDLELSPNGAKSVDGLVFELPIAREIAQYLLTGNGPNASIAALKADYKSGFIPSLWLGNDDGGLAVFTESDQYWRPRDRGAVEITLSQDTALLKLNVLRAPLELKGPISYSFGLMASPVRPVVEGDPFLLGFQYTDADEIVYPEFLAFPAQGIATPEEGTLEFWARRSKAGTDTVALFSIVEKELGAPLTGGNAPYVQCNVSSGIYLDVNQTRLLTTNMNLSGEEFSHIALVWDSKAVSLYVNGRRAATAEATEAFRKVLDNAAHREGELRLGCRDEAAPGNRMNYLGVQVFYGCRDESKGFTAVDVDDIRVSSTARYQGESFAPPTGPFQKDADTRLLDALDESFVPDGQDALTAAGGVPSLGCRFNAGKFGRALRIETAPPHPAAELIKDSNSTLTQYWNWVYGTDLEGGNQGDWPPAMFGPAAEAFKDAIQVAHRRGLKIIPYTGYPAIGGPSELADQFGSEWQVLPLDLVPYPPPEGHYMMNSTLSARGFADYMAAGVVRLMDLGCDGIYNDGLGSCVWPSQNLYARAGYVDENGNLRPTVPFFGWREGMKRLYRVVKARQADGIVCNHCSFNMPLPTMSFSDIYYTGEHEDYENFANTQLRFSSRPWGLQTVLLGASSHMYSSAHTMVELLLGSGQFGYDLVDRGGLGRKWMNFRKAYLAFGYQSAEWVPFFKNCDTYYTTEDPKTKISLYYHKGEDAFLVVGNTDAQNKDVSVQLHLKAFGLEGAALRARNALTQVPLALAQDGKLNVSVRAKSFVLVAVEPNP
jgi:hypothetical protein